MSKEFFVHTSTPEAWHETQDLLHALGYAWRVSKEPRRKFPHYGPATILFGGETHLGLCLTFGDASTNKATRVNQLTLDELREMVKPAEPLPEWLQ